MGRQLFRTQYKQRVIGAGSDEVIGVMPIPSGGMVANVWGDVHLVAQTNLDRDLAAVYACGGWIMPTVRATAAVSVDTLFDEMVTKDADASVGAQSVNVDDDPLTADATPFEEPGEPNLSRVYNMGAMAERIYNRERILTIASRGLMEPVASSEVDLWMPTDHFKIRISKKFRVSTPSYLMFAVAVPTLDDMTTTNETSLLAFESRLLENLEMAIELSMPMIVGITEATAETPFAELAQFIEKLVEPTTEEETAGAFAQVIYTVFARFTFEVQLGRAANSGPIAG